MFVCLCLYVCCFLRVFPNKGFVGLLEFEGGEEATVEVAIGFA